MHLGAESAGSSKKYYDKFNPVLKKIKMGNEVVIVGQQHWDGRKRQKN